VPTSCNRILYRATATKPAMKPAEVAAIAVSSPPLSAAPEVLDLFESVETAAPIAEAEPEADAPEAPSLRVAGIFPSPKEAPQRAATDELMDELTLVATFTDVKLLTMLPSLTERPLKQSVQKTLCGTLATSARAA